MSNTGLRWCHLYQHFRQTKFSKEPEVLTEGRRCKPLLFDMYFVIRFAVIAFVYSYVDAGFTDAKKNAGGFYQDFFTAGASKDPAVKIALGLGVGDRAYAYAVRPGSHSDGHRCDSITAVPRHLTFITRYNHYRKYTHAYNIPIVSSYAVPDAALKRACYVLRFLLADRRVLRKYLYRYYGRIGIMGAREGTTSIPEHRHLGRGWDTRARGLGGTLHIPISTGAEENLLCYSNDRYRVEDIFLHEFSHGISEIAIKGGGIRGYTRRLESAYANARRYGLWRSTYAMNTVQEYFAEGVQSYFDVNAYSARPNGIHNHVNTRAKLRTYDPTLFRLVKEVFPCMNIYHKRCNKASRPGSFRMNCDGDGTPRTIKPVTKRPPATRPPPTTKDSITIMPPLPEKTTLKPTTKKPTTPKPLECIDRKTTCSRGWQKYCLDPKYKVYMKTTCTKTCCCDAVDANANCPAWAKAGYCAANKGYMLRFCKKSCGCL